MEKVGITTTIPVEVIFAAKKRPIDLNNLFVEAADSLKYTENAQLDGFPRNICAWIKGLYSVATLEGIGTVVGVVEGDCSNTRSLVNVWEQKDLNIIPFGFPYSKEYKEMKKQIDFLKEYFSVNDEQILAVQKKLFPIRQKLKYLDQLTWKENLVSGFENHFWQVSSSDFFGEPERFAKELDDFIKEVQEREAFAEGEVRLGFVGVPPILKDLYPVIEAYGGRVVFNEVQRAFTMAEQAEDADIVQMYLDFTYPYGVNDRITDIQNQIKERRLDGIIHYTQSFCHRGIDDILFKQEIEIPILTIEGDLPGNCDSRTKLRLESFLDMLKDFKRFK